MTNTTTERRLAITPGEARIIDGDFLYVLNEDGSNRIHFGISKGWESEWKDGGIRTKQEEANDCISLYADAHNTYNACGLTPSELWARVTKLRSERDELVGALEEIVYQADEGMPIIDVSPCIVKASKLLAKHKPE